MANGTTDATRKDEDRPSYVASDTAILQLHAAEYTALTTRATYWHVLEFSLLPIIPFYIWFGFELWKADILPHEVIVWISLTGLYLLGILWGQSQLERYTMVTYLETELRPRIVEQFGITDDLWSFERYFSRHRAVSAWWIENAPVIIGALVFLATVGVRCLTRTASDRLWLDLLLGAVALGALAVFIRDSVKAGTLRENWAGSPADASQESSA